MNTPYEFLIQKYSSKNLEDFETCDSFYNELHDKCNTDYDTFVSCCKKEDAKENLSEKEEYATSLYKNWLNELNIPFEECFFSLYNKRIIIKGLEWEESYGVMNTMDLIAIKCSEFEDYDCDYRFIDLPGFI